jgi:hypothetical protein
MHARLRRPAAALISTTLAASVLGLAPAAHAADGTLSGTITGSGAGALADVEVALFEYDAEDGYWAYVDKAYTDGAGSYSFVVPAGAYRLGFYDYANGFLGEYFQDAADVYDADTITVPSAGTFVADAELSPGAHITGEVTGPGAVDLQDIYVDAYEAVEEDGDLYYDWAGSARTGVDGTYDIGGLTGGTYRIQFSDAFFDEDQTYAAEFYNDTSSIYAADDVTVGAHATRSGIDAELELDAEFSGRVTDSSGAGVEDAWVDALVKVGEEWEYAGYAYTNPDGTYVLDGLRAGTYRVEIGGIVGDDYAYEYWNDKARIENADDVVLADGSATTDVNAVLVPGEHSAETTLTNTARPTVSGAPVVGSTLTASVGSWTPTPTEYYFSWLRDGDFIDGAYGSTYVPTAADVGKTITVLVTAAADGWWNGYAESAPTAPVTAAVAPVPTPTPTIPTPTVDVPAGLAAILGGLDVAGKPKVGKTVKVTGLDKLLRSSTAVSYKFQWFAGKKKVKKATKSKLKVTRAMKGKKLSVKVTATAASTSKSVRLKVGKVR